MFCCSCLYTTLTWRQFLALFGLFSSVPWFRFCYSSRADTRSCSRVDGGFYGNYAAIFSWYQACSMVFISSEVGSHSSRVLWCCSMNSWHISILSGSLKRNEIVITLHTESNSIRHRVQNMIYYHHHPYSNFQNLAHLRTSAHCGVFHLVFSDPHQTSKEAKFVNPFKYLFFEK